MCQNVEMILHATNTVKVTLVVLVNSPDVFEKFVTAVSVQHGATILGTEDDVEEQLGIRIGHGTSAWSAANAALVVGDDFLPWVTLRSPTAIHIKPLRGCGCNTICHNSSIVGLFHNATVATA